MNADSEKTIEDNKKTLHMVCRSPAGSSETGQITDATGLTTTITLDNKALEFQSTGRRQGAQIHYDAGLDSGQGGGAGGGFPYWEVAGDWAVTHSARCVVSGRNQMTKVAGTKERQLSCYVEWMAGSGKEYVGSAHCEVGANNTKPVTSMSYQPASCPHPEWVFGSWGSWSYTNNWYRASGDASKTCGNITEYRDKRRTRTATCRNGSYSDCTTFNGSPATVQTGRDSRTRSLGACYTCTWGGAGYTAGGTVTANTTIYGADYGCRCDCMRTRYTCQSNGTWVAGREYYYHAGSCGGSR